MAYFTAVIARSGTSWKARDVEVDDVSSLEELADALRSASQDDQPVLAVIEHEDEWFALIRVDGDDEPRIFVSDLATTVQGHYAGLLASAADVEVVDEVVDDDAGEDESGDDDEQEEPVVAAWAGDPEILDDLGVSARALRKLTEERGDDPGAVLAEIGETVGFSDLLDALR
ncbi:MAG TPA: tRNA adenosine deaminase-associated protein [Kineosporiaceae bacterium]